MSGIPSDTPAQVLKIVWRLPNLFTANPFAFFCIHERFIGADVILKKGVHLLGITKETAIFLQVDDDCDLFNPRINPIVSASQTANASRMIVLRIGDFNRIVDKVDISDRKVVWMFHTARCGSTTWVQIFHSLPGWTVFSEPQAMAYTCCFGNHIDHQNTSIQRFSKSQTFKNLVKSIIKIYLYHAPANSSVFWKTTSLGNHMADTIKTEFPDHKLLLAYRDILPSLKSYYCALQSIPRVNLAYKSFSENPLNETGASYSYWLIRIYSTNGYDLEFIKELIQKVMPQGVEEWLALSWAAILSSVIQSVRNGAKIKAINYQELKANPRAAIAKVFRYVNVDEENVDMACKALDVDSQEGNTLSRRSRTNRNAKEWDRSEDTVKRCNMLLAAFQLQDFDSSISVNFDL